MHVVAGRRGGRGGGRGHRRVREAHEGRGVGEGEAVGGDGRPGGGRVAGQRGGEGAGGGDCRGAGGRRLLMLTLLLLRSWLLDHVGRVDPVSPPVVRGLEGARERVLAADADGAVEAVLEGCHAGEDAQDGLGERKNG